MKLNIGTKLSLGYSITIIFLIIVAIVGFISARDINSSTNTVYEHGVIESQELAVIDSTIKQIRGDVFKYI